MRHRLPGIALLAGCLAGFSGAARAGEIDWSAIAAAPVVEVVSRDADGSLRETETWIVVLDGAGWVRTSRKSLFANLGRDPDARIRVDGREVPVRASFADDAALEERVERAHAEKYGDCKLCRLFRLGSPRTIRFGERP